MKGDGQDSRLGCFRVTSQVSLSAQPWLGKRAAAVTVARAFEYRPQQPRLGVVGRAVTSAYIASVHIFLCNSCNACQFFCFYIIFISNLTCTIFGAPVVAPLEEVEARCYATKSGQKKWTVSSMGIVSVKYRNFSAVALTFPWSVNIIISKLGGSNIWNISLY
jgi:hypothetical protein